MRSRTTFVVVITALAVLVVAIWAPRLLPRAHQPAPPAGSLARRVELNGVSFDVVELSLDRYQLALVGGDGQGRKLSEVDGALRTNAGIFEPDFTPTGLLVRDGLTVRPLNRAAGEGNFFLRPNGVFQLDARGARVLETSEYTGEGVTLATQSGPLLLHRGAVHPAFKPSSANRVIRSGVGVRDARTVVFVISRDLVTLYDFAVLFRDQLGCPDALYLDGIISGQWTEGLELDADTGPFAGILTATARSP
ncbi:MAG: phosphodiester glycosidase family protein [Myxococcaceae bacterium]|nr:phosphodiester glycosidase family protein [Myxococcaceae bacterium]